MLANPRLHPTAAPDCPRPRVSRNRSAASIKNIMAKRNHNLENGIISHFASTQCNVIFESLADIQGFDQSGSKVIGEFKSESEHEKNYSWWSCWKDRLENNYRANFSCMKPENKRWLAVVDGQLREYCQLENIGIGYLVVENYDLINTDIIDALEFLVSEGKIKCFSGPTSDSQGVGYYKITY